MADDLNTNAHMDTVLSEHAVEDLVSAILGNKNVLSPEDLKAFDALLNVPHIDAPQRRELLQTLWNIVVSIIDFRWHYSPDEQTYQACGQKANTAKSKTLPSSSVLSSQDTDILEIYNNAADHTVLRGRESR